MKNIKNKDLSEIECFQCCLSIENLKSVFFTLELCAEWNKRARRELANKNDNCMV